MRYALDFLYRLSAWAGALCLAAICGLVALQLSGRILDGVLKLAGFKPYGFVILSLAEIAGYLLAAASFLALAPTLKAGAHIRVTMLLSVLSETARRGVEIAVLAAAAICTGVLTWSIGRLAQDSFKFNEVSTGLVPVPLVWPQAAMTVGLIVLTIALIDEMLIVLTRGRPSFRASEDAITLGKEG